MEEDMEEESTTSEHSRSERDGSSLGRRDYLRLTGAAGVIGLGSSAVIGEASADSEPQRTLTIEGTGSRATYEFSVGGNVVKSTAMGAGISSEDTISGNSVSGHSLSL